MNTSAYDMALILQDSGVGSLGEDLFVGKEPESPYNCVTLYDTGGYANAGIAYDDLKVQIRVRNPSYKDAFVKADSCGVVFRAKPTVVIDYNNSILESSDGAVLPFVKYVGFWELNAPLFIKTDNNSNSIVVINYQITRLPYDGGHRQRVL